MAKRKCKICNEWIEDNADSISYKNGYVHKQCFNIAMKVTTTEKKESLSKKSKVKVPKPQKELKEGLSEEEYQDKKKLCDYIRELTREDVSVATYKLIEDYRKKYKITYEQMYSDLYWYFDICNHAVEGDMVVGIVPMCHTEAQKYYESIRQSNASCQANLEKLPNMYKKSWAVTSTGNRSKPVQIDIAAIGGDET